MKERVRVVVGDDHPLIREAIRRRFQATEDIELVGEAASGEEILELLAKEDGSVDLAILDIHMPPVDGIETTRMIREKHPEVEVLILTGTAELVVVLDGLRMGAKGYVLKHRDAQFLIDAVRLVANGNVMIDPDFVDALAEHLTRSKDPDDSLTRREVELLQLVALGRNNSEAGHTLLVSEGTVKADLHRIMSKLGANDRTSAVAEAFRRRLIE